MRTFLLITILLTIALVSCDNQKKAQNTKETVVTLNNYAVVWDILTDDHNYVVKYLPQQAEEFEKLFSQGIIANAYLNTYELVQLNENAALASVMFFIKAESVIAAQAIIDKMAFVENKVATYNVYPVGAKWLDRKPTADVDKKFSFATIWFLEAGETKIKQYVQEQNDTVLQLWKEGTIENAYFATENAFEKKSLNPAMVFFVNAMTEEEAHKICDALPFTKEGITSYKIFPVGTFWLGRSQ